MKNKRFLSGLLVTFLILFAGMTYVAVASDVVSKDNLTTLTSKDKAAKALTLNRKEDNTSFDLTDVQKNRIRIVDQGKAPEAIKEVHNENATALPEKSRIESQEKTTFSQEGKHGLVQRPFGVFPWSTPYMAKDDAYTIITYTGAFNTQVGIPKFAPELSAQPPEKSAGYYIVQLAGIDKYQAFETVQKIKKEGKVLFLERLTHGAWFVYGVKQDINDLTNWKDVNFITYYEPGFKIHPLVGSAPLFAKDADSPVFHLEIDLFPNASAVKFQDIVEDLGGVVIDVDENKSLITIFADLDFNRIKDLAQYEGIKVIFEVMPKFLMNDTTPQVIQTGTFGNPGGVDSRLYNQKGITGQGQKIAMMDDGLDVDCGSFANTSANAGTPGASHRKVYSYTSYGGGDSLTCSSSSDVSHGTLTTSMAIADPDSTSCNTADSDGDGWSDTLGSAYLSKVVFQDIADSSDCASGSVSPPFSPTTAFTDARTSGAYIHNDSWGGGTAQSYDGYANSIDDFSWHHLDFLDFISAGNSGNADMTPPATAKNDVTVGGNLSYPNQDTRWSGENCGGGSTQGPESSSRIGPQIMTPATYGTGLGGAAHYYPYIVENNDTNLTNPVTCNAGTQPYCGTSFSSPEAAGAALLIRQYYVDGFYPSGVASAPDSITPSNALLKATLLASGELLTSGVGATPTRFSNYQGYGRAELDTVLPLQGETTTAQGLVIRDYGLSAPPVFPYNFTVTAQNNGKPLRVMLVWMDAPGSALQNDLDLRVYAPDSTMYRGNDFSGEWTTTGGAADSVNTTEGVFIQGTAVQNGTYTIRVSGTVPTPNPIVGSQPFAVVVAGAVVNASYVYLDRTEYGCGGNLSVEVTDIANPTTTYVSNNTVITTALNGGDSETIATWTKNGNKYTSGQLQIVSSSSPIPGNGTLEVDDADTITVTYTDGTSHVSTDTALTHCNPHVSDYGYRIDGGCDEETNAPALNHAADFHTEYYNWYMDNGELIHYTFVFNNDENYDLTDARAQLALSGAGAANVSILGNNPVYIGRIQAKDINAAIFDLSISGAAALTSVNLDVSITSPADGFNQPTIITHTRLLQADDYVTQQNTCWQHVSGDGFTAQVWGTSNTAPWALATCPGPAPTNSCICNSTASTNTHKTNRRCNRTFTQNCDEILYTPTFRPINTGIEGVSGQQWYWAWKQQSFWYIGDMIDASSNISAAWGIFYDPFWNASSPPSTGDEIDNFPIGVAYYLLDDTADCGANTWCAAGTICDDSQNTSKSQMIISFNPKSVQDQSDATDYWVYGHEFIDATLLSSSYTGASTYGLNLDDDSLVWDEFHAGAEDTACSAQCGSVSFDKLAYENCAGDTAHISVLDSNGVAPLTVTVDCSGTGDSETVTLTGVAPYFSADLPISFSSGAASDDGTIFVLPSLDTITATYNDSDDGTGNSCSDQDQANTLCPSGDVVYVQNNFTDNGDSDNYPDTNETITMNIQIQNNMSSDLLNTIVTIETTTPSIVDCIIDPTADYGTVAAGNTAWNPVPDTFQFHIDPTVECSDFKNPPRARFIVHIIGTDFNGSSSLQTFTMDCDLSPLIPPYPALPPVTYDFNTDPAWTVQVGPGDDDGACSSTYVNDFHWCDVCGNGDGGYGAWSGNAAFNGGGSYSNFSDSLLISPVLTASGSNATISFDYAYGTETNYDGAAVYWQTTGAGSWTNLNFTNMIAFNPNTSYCNPLDSGSTQAWSNTGPNAWATSNTVTLSGSASNTFQVRWRLGSDSTYNYTGFGVDNVVLTNLAQTVGCDATDNSVLPACPVLAPPPVADGQTGSEATFVKASGNDIDVTFDHTTCSGDHAVVVYGNIGTYSSYAGTVSTGCNIGNSGSATFSMSSSNVWFNIVWVTSSGVGGHPGYESASTARTWNVDPLCSTTGDDHADGTCD